MNNNEEEEEPTLITRPAVGYYTGSPILTSGSPTLYGIESSGTYYPAGSALLRPDERNYDSYKNLFGEDLDEKKLKEIDEYDKKKAKEKLDILLPEYASSQTKYLIVEKILLTAIVVMFFSLPLLIFVEGDIENTLGKWLPILIYYCIISLFVLFSYHYTEKFNLKIKKLQIEIDLTKFKGQKETK